MPLKLDTRLIRVRVKTMDEIFRRPLYWRWNRDTDELTPTDRYEFMQAWDGPDEFRAQRVVEQTMIQQPDVWLIPKAFRDDGTKQEPILVSTAFLVLDHAFQPEETPILFETMIFHLPPDHPLEEYQRRYCTAAEARKGHEEAVKRVADAIRDLPVPTFFRSNGGE